MDKTSGSKSSKDRSRQPQKHFYGRYTRIPKTFMEGVTLIPHNFNMPEKPVHGEIVHEQLREDLFDTAYKKVKYLETDELEGDDDYFRLKSIEKADCQTKGVLQSFLEARTKTNDSDDYICCEKWIIDHSGTREVTYNVKILQSQNDHFYTIVHPDTLWKNAKLYFNYGSL